MNNNVVNLKELKQRLKEHHGKSIGIITGCFDILHTGHIDLFQFAKSNVDILVVAIDTDEAINKTKGDKRPIFNQELRAKMLSVVTHVDFVLYLSSIHEFSTVKADRYYDDVILKLKPTYLITASADKYCEAKKRRTELVGGALLIYKRKRPNSSTDIVDKIMKLGL